MKQLDLPGIDPPTGDTASPDETAQTVLIFDDDDAIVARVVQALNSLLFARYGSLANARALLRALTKGLTSGVEEFPELNVYIRAIVREELSKLDDME